MIILFTIITLLLLGCSLWFWYLSQAKIIHLTITSFSFVERKITVKQVNDLKLALKGILDYIVAHITIGILLIVGFVLGFFSQRSSFIFSSWDLALLSLISAFILASSLVGRQYQGIICLSRPPRAITYGSTVKLPKRVYEGDSQNIALLLKRETITLGWHPESFDVSEDKDGKSTRQQVALTVQDGREQSLEVQLLAAGFTVKGEEKQRQSLTREYLGYRWNCAFPNAGRHEIALVFKVIRSSSEHSLGAIEQTVKVVKFDHATQRQVRLAAIITGIAVLISTIITIVASIHQLSKP